MDQGTTLVSICVSIYEKVGCFEGAIGEHMLELQKVDDGLGFRQCQYFQKVALLIICLGAACLGNCFNIHWQCALRKAIVGQPQ